MEIALKVLLMTSEWRHSGKNADGVELDQIRLLFLMMVQERVEMEYFRVLGN